MISDIHTLKTFLDSKVALYNKSTFIDNDPVSIPHAFSKMQDIEIAGLFAATLSWGNRTTIIKNSKRIMTLMDNSPHDFILNHTDNDLKPFLGFVHRTYNTTDLLYFIALLKHHYKNYNTLEDAFVTGDSYTFETVVDALKNFHEYFFSIEHPERTKKHVPTPLRNSACKRINMYLRWMVRHDNNGVDFGIWHKIKPAQLLCPLDVHVARVAVHLGMMDDQKSNMKNALHLTAQLRVLNPQDPVIYDYALFGLGVGEGVAML